MTTSIKDDMLNFAKVIDISIDALMPKQNTGSIVDSMRYSLIGGGKRIRAFMMHCIGDIFDARPEEVIRVACALEMIHCYSLIHDDLPALDNDDYRRGKLSNHKKFNEATAILTGDSLLALAFEVVSDPEFNITNDKKVNIMHIMSNVSGCKNIIKGQMMDIDANNRNVAIEELLNIHLLKTAAMFKAACAISVEICDYISEEMRSAIFLYAENFGMLFQLIDDWHDYDHESNAANIISIIGHNDAHIMANDIMRSALLYLSKLPQHKHGTKQLITLTEDLHAKLEQ